MRGPPVLQPSSRRLLLETLRPPAGYRLDRAVGTTYSLDLLTLLTAPLAFTFFDWEDESGRPTADPLALLEAVRRSAERITVFCQAGRIQVPRSGQPLLAYLEPSVIEVSPEAGVFHPKVWLLRYAAKDEPVRYRLVCLSRNLTFDRSWDTALVLDGELTERRNAFASQHPLGDLFAALPCMALHPDSVSGTVQSAIDQMQHEVRRVAFELPEDFEAVAFHPLGIEGASHWPFPDDARACAIVSPFLTPTLIDRLADGRERVVLVSRPEALAQLPAATFERISEAYTLAEEAEPDVEGEDQPEAESESDRLTGLHAKLFVIDDGWHARVFTGSANATQAAFHQNVELLVELRGKKSRVGVEALLGAGDGSARETRLRSLLKPFEPSSEAAPPDEAASALEQRLDAARRALAGTRLRAWVEPMADADTYAITLERSDASVALPAGCTARCWPASLPHTAAVALVADAEKAPSARFAPVSFAALTSFFAFEIHAAVGDREGVARFALNLPLEGAPPDRREAVLRALLRDREQLMRLLWLLLAGEELSAADFADLGGPAGPGSAHASAGWARFPLLESLLRALSRDPSRLDEVARLIEDLRRTPEGRELLPEELLTVWAPIWAARQELGKADTRAPCEDIGS